MLQQTVVLSMMQLRLDFRSKKAKRGHIYLLIHLQLFTFNLINSMVSRSSIEEEDMQPGDGNCQRIMFLYPDSQGK